MASENNADYQELRWNSAAQQERNAEHRLDAISERQNLHLSSQWLGNPKLHERSNAPLRADLITQGQMTHGNRNMQRCLHKGPTPSISSRLTVQRYWDEYGEWQPDESVPQEEVRDDFYPDLGQGPIIPGQVMPNATYPPPTPLELPADFYPNLGDEDYRSQSSRSDRVGEITPDQLMFRNIGRAPSEALDAAGEATGVAWDVATNNATSGAANIALEAERAGHLSSLDDAIGPGTMGRLGLGAVAGPLSFGSGLYGMYQALTDERGWSNPNNLYQLGTNGLGAYSGLSTMGVLGSGALAAAGNVAGSFVGGLALGDALVGGIRDVTDSPYVTPISETPWEEAGRFAWQGHGDGGIRSALDPFGVFWDPSWARQGGNREASER